MRKLYKVLTVTNLTIEVEEPQEVKNISRVRIRLFQDGDPSRVHANPSYAQISSNSLYWQEAIQFPFVGQTCLTFQTDCEHEYGYEQEELHVLYRGVYFLRNEMFFRGDSCHIYNPQGEKKGILKLQVRVNTKQEHIQQEKCQENNQPLVPENLIGLIKINGAYFENINPNLSKKHNQPLSLKLTFGNSVFTFQSIDNRWSALNTRLEFLKEGPNNITFDMLQNERELLNGTVLCEQLEDKKRYISYKIGMFNKHRIKIGHLVMDFRFVEKQELLDLIYSPTNKLNHITKTPPTAGPLSSLHISKSTNKSFSAKKDSNFNRSQLSLPKSRYKIGFLMTKNSDILIPKANRFQTQKPINPNVSYIDPEKVSDFSSRLHKGPAMSRGTKFDFTKPFRNNPGVGEYQLPSIWSKY